MSFLFWTGLAAGMIIGAFLGLIITALWAAGRQASEDREWTK